MNDQTLKSQFNFDDLASEARDYFNQHYNCAQSVFAPFTKRFGMDMDHALRIATSFGGGMGHAGQTCGAVSGALMAIGLYRGIIKYDRQQKYTCYDFVNRFQVQFRGLHGDLTCPGLLGRDIGKPEELAHVREEGSFHNFCPQLVADAARFAGELILESA